MWKTGVIREIRRLYPTANIRLVVCSKVYVLAETCPYVDEIILNPHSFIIDFVKMFEWDMNFARQLLAERVDICYTFNYYLPAPLLMYMSGARERISYKFEDDENCFPDVTSTGAFLISPIKRQHLNPLATVSVPQFLYGDNAHSVDIGFSLLDYAMRTPISNRSMEIWYTPLDMNVAKSFLRNRRAKTYALAMGGGHRKFYPPQKYAELLAMILREEPDTTFVIVGGSNEKSFAEIVKNLLGEKIFNEHIMDLTEKLTYRQTGAVLTMCDMYIGNDTGTMHVAASVKCPCLAVFAFPADAPSRRIDLTKTAYPYNVPNVIVQPGHALPECKNGYNIYGCKSGAPHCITQIKPETVFKGFKLLKARIAENNIEPLYLT